MNEYIMFGLCGAGIMCLIGGIKTLIIGKPDMTFIPNTFFGFVMGAVGKYIIDTIMLELYPLHPILAIVLIVLFGLGVLMTVISMIFRRVE